MFQFVWKEDSTNVDGREAVCRIDQTSPFFDGHFPGNPILPAAVLIQASLDFIRETESSPSPLRGIKIKNAKFSKPIAPGALLNVWAKATESGWEVNWSDSENNADVAVLSFARLG